MPKRKKKAAVAYQGNQVSSAHIDYNVQERRLYFLCLTKLLPKLPGMLETGQVKFEPITIPRRELAEWFGNNNVSQFITDKALKSMFNKVLELDIDRSYTLQHVFRYLRYDREACELHVLFDELMAPFLLELVQGGYTKVVLEQFFRISSAYAQALYVLIMEYRKLGERTIDMDALRFSLGVTEIYPRMKDFTIRVLDPAVEEISSKTLYVVEYKKNKVGRAIESITFTWHEKAFLPDGSQAKKPKPSLAARKRQDKAYDRKVAEITAGYYEAEKNGTENDFIASLPKDMQAKIRKRLAGD